jgi:hypothetical protein
MLDQVEKGLKPEIERLAEHLAADPKRRLTKPRGEDTLLADTKSILCESLLGFANE